MSICCDACVIHIYIQNYNENCFGEMFFANGCILWTVSDIILELADYPQMEHLRLGMCGVSSPLPWWALQRG